MKIKTKKNITFFGIIVIIFVSIYINSLFFLLAIIALPYFVRLKNREIIEVIMNRFENNENLYFEDFIILKNNNWCFKDDNFINNDRFINLSKLLVDYKVNKRNYIQ